MTDEFYAWVTVSWVTPALTGGPDAIHKPAACRWLRSSSYNCADQSSFVIESLYKNFGPRSAGEAASATRSAERPRPREPKMSERVFAGLSKSRRSGRAGRRCGSLGPLSELRFEDVVDVHSDPADTAFVDFNLVQVGGGMGEPLR